VCVVVPRASMRAEPNMRSEITWTVTQNMPLMRLEKKGSWTHVEDLDGEKHWIQSSAVSGRVACAVVKSKTARLRKGPDSSAPLAEIPIVDKYTPFRRLAGEGEFFEVVDEFNGRYWINEQNIWYPVKKMQIKFSATPKSKQPRMPANSGPVPQKRAR
jgi:SH3-like domain-containing protein